MKNDTGHYLYNLSAFYSKKKQNRNKDRKKTSKKSKTEQNTNKRQEQTNKQKNIEQRSI